MVDATNPLVDAWERAMNRALARGIDVELVSSERIGYDVTTRYRTSSTSHPGSVHYVLVSYSGRGVETQCDCEGGQSSRCCAHAAAALLAEQWLPFRPIPEPVQPEPEPEPLVTRMSPRQLMGYLATCERDPQFG